jgi:HAD superfamily hydrolase (TIGR01490 family)
MLALMEAAFFDLDKTVIAKASMVAFGRPLLQAGMISRRLMVRALWSQLVFQWFGANEEKMRKFRESALRITRGWDQAHIRELVRDNLTTVIEPLVFDEALELIRAHQSEGRKVFIISASPEEVVAPLGLYLGVDGVIATRARIDGEGRYTGDVEFYSYGPYKAEAMREVAMTDGIDLARSYAYSDSMTDLPMLEVVGHPVVVNPDRDLARIARDRDWEMRIFRIGVPLRERVAMPPPRLTAAIGGGALLGAVGAALLWWVLRRQPPPPPTRMVRLRSSFRNPAASSPRKQQGRGRR